MNVDIRSSMTSARPPYRTEPQHRPDQFELLGLIDARDMPHRTVDLDSRAQHPRHVVQTPAQRRFRRQQRSLERRRHAVAERDEAYDAVEERGQLAHNRKAPPLNAGHEPEREQRRAAHERGDACEPAAPVTGDEPDRGQSQ